MIFFSDIKEIQNYLTANASFSLARIKPHISRAEDRYIRDILGATLYREFATAYKAALISLAGLAEEEKNRIMLEGSQLKLMPDKFHEPMRYIQDAVANIAFMNGLSQMQTQIGDSGIRIAVNENLKTAFQWQIDDLKYQLASDAYAAMDKLIQSLWENVTDFASWQQSDSYYLQTKYFVRTAEQFNSSYYISNQHMTFLTLRYVMNRVELFDVQRIITPEVFSRLKKKTEYTDKENVLVNTFLVPGIVLLTVAKGIIDRLIDVSDIGVQANMYSYYATLKDPRKKGEDVDGRDKMIEQLSADGNMFLEQARNYIEANSAEFGSIAQEVAPQSFNVINSENRKIFGL